MLDKITFFHDRGSGNTGIYITSAKTDATFSLVTLGTTISFIRHSLNN